MDVLYRQTSAHTSSTVSETRLAAVVQRNHCQAASVLHGPSDRNKRNSVPVIGGIGY
jgi:hypothetical protein